MSEERRELAEELAARLATPEGMGYGRIVSTGYDRNGKAAVLVLLADVTGDPLECGLGGPLRLEMAVGPIDSEVVVLTRLSPPLALCTRAAEFVIPELEP